MKASTDEGLYIDIHVDLIQSTIKLRTHYIHSRCFRYCGCGYMHSLHTLGRTKR